MGRFRSDSAVHIEILGLSCRSRLGVGPEERRRLQKIALDLILEAAAARGAEKDDILLVPDYKKLADAARRIAAQGERRLAEHLALSVARTILDEDRKISRVSVRVHKRPASMPRVREVVVEITRSRTIAR